MPDLIVNAAWGAGRVKVAVSNGAEAITIATVPTDDHMFRAAVASMTPGEARALAEMLETAADDVEVRSNVEQGSDR